MSVITYDTIEYISLKTKKKYIDKKRECFHSKHTEKNSFFFLLKF